MTVTNIKTRIRENDVQQFPFNLNDFQCPEMINAKDIFKIDIEAQAFFVEMGKLLDLVFCESSCGICLEDYTTSSNDEDLFNRLFLSRSKDSHLLQPSKVFLSFCYKLEYVFREIEDKTNNVQVQHLKELFIHFVKSKIPVGFNHCENIYDEFLIKFINLRFKLSHEVRFIHKKQKFASKFQ